MQVRVSTMVPCSPEQAFAFVSNPANDTRWRSHLVASHGSANGVGDHVFQTYSYEGHTKQVTMEVAEYQPPERLTYLLTEPTRIRLAFQFRPETGGARVSASLSTVLSGPAALLEGRIETEAERLLRTDLERLRLACAP